MTVPDNPVDLVARIRNLKEDLGKELLILTHHYQRKEIIELGDFRGDSFGLSQKASQSSDARFIVFCGVHFMAESAAILAQPHQTVQIPDLEAGCWMADMSEIQDVEKAWEGIASLVGNGSVVPIVYMNSDAHLKAFCGHHGGAVCTSSNAEARCAGGLRSVRRSSSSPISTWGAMLGTQWASSPER